jgi:predicted Zn-dependent protease
VRLSLWDLLTDGNGTFASDSPIAFGSRDANTGATTLSASAAVTPLETYGTRPLSWANPTQITVAVATHTYSDQAVSFSSPLPPNAITLLHAAEHAWEAVANVHFVEVPDNATNNVSAADIRVGLGRLPSIGFTAYSWDLTNNSFTSGTTVALDDVGASNVTPLSNGNVRYSGTQTTVFQNLLHELGHAIGLDHNPYDPSVIMNPTLSSANPFITWQDTVMLRALYGAPSASAVANAQADPVLSKLLPSGVALPVPG